jgi:hypothetical protein
VFPPTEESYKYIYEGASPDTLVWEIDWVITKLWLTTTKTPAYASYPVVGVNWIQAVEFSKWRTDRVNEAILEKTDI